MENYNFLANNPKIRFTHASDISDEDLTSLICVVDIAGDYVGQLSRVKHEWKVSLVARDVTGGDIHKAKDIDIDWKDFIGIFHKFMLHIEQSDAHYIRNLRKFTPEDEDEIYAKKDDETD